MGERSGEEKMIGQSSTKPNPRQDRFLPHSFHPTLCVLFLTTLTPERLYLESWFKGELEDGVKDTG